MVDEISMAEIQPLCPECGANLLIEQLGDDPEPHDRVLCPTHGTVGTRQEIRADIFEQIGDKVVDHTKGMIDKALKDMGFKRD